MAGVAIMRGMGLVEDGDTWLVPLKNAVVSQCCFDRGGVVLQLATGASGWELRTGQPFRLTKPGSATELVAPEEERNLVAALRLLSLAADNARAYKDGRLNI